MSGTAGALLYVAGHAAVKGALFLIAGVMLAQYGSVDEYDLFGRGTGEKIMGWALVVIGALGLAGLPPFGTALGKALSEDAGTAAGYPWVPVLFVAVSALDGRAVLRVAGRVYFALGPRPIEWSKVRSQRQWRGRRAAIANTCLGPWAPPFAPPRRGLHVGVIPGAHSVANRAAATFIDSAGYAHQALYRLSEGTLRRKHPIGRGSVLCSVLPQPCWRVCVAAAGLYGSRLDREVAGLAGGLRPSEPAASSPLGPRGRLCRLDDDGPGRARRLHRTAAALTLWARYFTLEEPSPLWTKSASGSKAPSPMCLTRRPRG